MRCTKRSPRLLSWTVQQLPIIICVDMSTGPPSYGTGWDTTSRYQKISCKQTIWQKTAPCTNTSCALDPPNVRTLKGLWEIPHGEQASESMPDEGLSWKSRQSTAEVCGRFDKCNPMLHQHTDPTECTAADLSRTCRFILC